MLRTNAGKRRIVLSLNGFGVDVIEVYLGLLRKDEEGEGEGEGVPTIRVQGDGRDDCDIRQWKALFIFNMSVRGKCSIGLEHLAIIRFRLL